MAHSDLIRATTPGGDDGDPGTEATTGTSQIIHHDTDDLLDEIDGLLEENAEDFVKAYVQKGGQ